MARMGIGRTPVREAVQRLHSDGFVTILPRRGTLVSEINITDLAAIYEVRRHLESWASQLAAERVTDADRGEIAGLLDALAAVSADDGFQPLLDLDRRVHRFVYRCAKNAYLAKTLDLYHDLSLRILHIAMSRYPSLTPRLEDVVHEQRTRAGGDRPRRRRDRRARRGRRTSRSSSARSARSSRPGLRLDEP